MIEHTEPHFSVYDHSCLCPGDCCITEDQYCICTGCSGTCLGDHPPEELKDELMPQPAKRAEDMYEVRVAVTYYRYWNCRVYSSGFHNGCKCTPGDPHGDWGCGYRWRGPDMTDEHVDQWLKDNPQPEGN